MLEALLIGLIPEAIAWLKAVRLQDEEAAKEATVSAMRKTKRAAVKKARGR